MHEPPDRSTTEVVEVPDTRDDHEAPMHARTSSGATTKLFRADRPSPSDPPEAVRFFEDFADRLGSGLGALTSLDAGLVFTSLTRDQAGGFGIEDDTVVEVSAMVAQWNARVRVIYDHLLLRRFMEIMFGGNAARAMTVPPRALTGFETALATSLTETILSELANTGIGSSDMSFADFECSDGIASPSSRDGAADTIVGRFHNRDFGDSLWIALPAMALDLISERASTNERHDAPGLDSRWTRELQTALGGIHMSLAAVAQIPSISMGDIAAFRPGSLLEFDGDCFNRVRLACTDHEVLVGRLGQSKGRYTLCVEAIPSDRTAPDGGTSASSGGPA